MSYHFSHKINDIETNITVSNAMSCCGILAIHRWHTLVDGDIEEAYNKETDSYIYVPDLIDKSITEEQACEVYESLMQQLIRRTGGHQLLMAADTATHAQYSEGLGDSNSSKMLSLRGFCKYHGFKITEKIPRGTGRTVNVHTFPLQRRKMVDKKVQVQYLRYREGKLSEGEWRAPSW